MAVYDGVPSIRLEGDKEAALALIPEAKALLYKVQTVKDRAGVNTFSMSRRVDADSTIYVLSSNGQNIITISVAVDVPEQVYPEAVVNEGTQSPDFYSGVVFGGFIEQRVEKNPDGTEIKYNVCAKFAPTDNCRNTHKELTDGRQDVKRLVVRPWAAFDELNNRSQYNTTVFSQYTLLRSSMYSGTMKKVVQIVMGLGRIEIPDPKPDSPKQSDSSPKFDCTCLDDPYDVVDFTEDKPPSEKKAGKESNAGKYSQEVKNNGVQVRYDWRFIRTHGIVEAADKKLWLVEISQQRGVLARPLPIFLGSDSEGFFKRAEGSKDTAMVTALEELKCLPTGESFPVRATTLDRKIKNGTILRLLTAEDIAPFYQCSPYSSAMGWAFSDTGNEAHNTAYYFGEDGFQRGVWYQINFKIGALKTKRDVNEPIAEATAELRKNHEGYIYCPPAIGTSPARFVPIKFHEPMLPGLISHEGVPSVEAAGKPVPRVDTPMFVSFVNGDLKVIRYYRNPKQELYDNTEGGPFPGECLLAGDWTTVQTSGIRSFPTMMYTNDFDHRKVLQETVVTTTITSQDLGYDPPKFSDFIQSPEAAYVWRNRIFRRTKTITNQGGEQVVAAVAIPQYSREAYYYATGRRFSVGHSGVTAVVYDVVKDPNVAYSWRCFPRISAPPFPPGRPDCNTEVCRGSAPCSSGGVGYPKERRVVCTAYEPDSGGPWVYGGGPGQACHEYADSGSWLEICQNVDSFNQPGMDKTGSTVTWDKGGDEEASLYLVTPGHGGPLKIPIPPGDVFNHWMRPSPDPETEIVQFIYAEHSAIGNDMLVYATGLSVSSGVEIKAIGYSPEEINENDGYPAFIGVNQP